MSAFVVTKNHIDALVMARVIADDAKLADVFPKDLDDTGQMLWDENRKSVDARYAEEGGGAEVYRFTKPTAVYPPAQVFKLIDCYEYQSCEHGGWEGSKAQKFCNELRHGLGSKLPGYGDAPWGIP